MRKRKIGNEEVYVKYNCGVCAYVFVNIYEGMTFEECLRLRSKDIDGYFLKNGKYIKLKESEEK